MNWGNIKTKSEKGGLYTGVTNFKVNAVNPTKEELSELLGRTFENDIVYDDRIDIRLSNDDVDTKVSFWPKNEEKMVQKICTSLVMAKLHGVRMKIHYQIGLIRKISE